MRLGDELEVGLTWCANLVTGLQAPSVRGRGAGRSVADRDRSA